MDFKQILLLLLLLKFKFSSLHRNTPAKALIYMGPMHAQLLNWKGTSTFILVIIKLWDMLNIKSYGKGIRLRKSDANCFESINDPRLVWMEKFVSWLHCWNRYNVQHDCGFLSKETYIALTHTVSTFVILIRDLLQHNVLKSILTGKLESRFGHYRQLSGSNYLVIVSDVLRCEKKFKVKRLLKLYSALKGTICILTYLEKFNDIQPGKTCTQFLKTLPYDTIDILCVKEDDLSPLLLISRYVARKTMEKLTVHLVKLCLKFGKAI